MAGHCARWVRMLPMLLLVAAALGFLVIGQTVSWSRAWARSAFGSIMVIVVVRELGPLLAALLVRAAGRIGERTARAGRSRSARSAGN